MVIDHIGVFLLPDVFFLRIIGRLSFILFAWLIANGAVHTRNINLYMKRLFLFALISQIPFMLVRRQLYPNSFELNIFFTLALGLAAIIVLQRVTHPAFKLLLVAGITFLAERFTGGFSYGAYGVVTILIFYLFYKNLKVAAFLQTLAIFGFYVFPILLSGNSIQHLYEHRLIGLIQPVGLLSLFFIASYKGILGPKAKWIFYIFYPLHLTIIYLLMLQI